MTIADPEVLKRNVKLILSQVKRPVSIYKADARTIRALFEAGAQGAAPPFDPPPPGTVEVDSEHLTLLRLLYAESSPNLRGQFVPVVLSEITEANAVVVVQAVLEVGSLGDLKTLLDEPKRLTYGLRHLIWAAVVQRLIMEAHRFTEADLDLLEAMATTEIDRTVAFVRSRGLTGGMEVTL